jgi:hypothetical protein
MAGALPGAGFQFCNCELLVDRTVVIFGLLGDDTRTERAVPSGARLHAWASTKRR